MVGPHPLNYEMRPCSGLGELCKGLLPLRWLSDAACVVQGAKRIKFICILFDIEAADSAGRGAPPRRLVSRALLNRPHALR